MENKSVNRKIYFYDLEVTTVDNGLIETCENPGERLKQFFVEYKKKYNQICSEKNVKKRKEEFDKLAKITENGERIYFVIDSSRITKSVDFQIVLLKDNLFPKVEKDGNLNFLADYIDGSFRLAEVTHCVIYFDELILGAEFNFSGARPSAVAEYIPYCDKGVYSVECIGKVKNDVIEELCEEKEYSLFDIKVKNTPEMKVAIVNSLPFIKGIFSSVDDVDTYEIILKRRITKKSSGMKLNLEKKKIAFFVSKNREEIANFRISQGAYKDSIDLLSDKMVGEYYRAWEHPFSRLRAP